MESGFGHDTSKKPENGALAIFCVACPQPGINLHRNWKKESRRYEYFNTTLIQNLKDNLSRWLYRRSYTADGFFSADHIRMKHEENDVQLMNGKGYMVESTKYEEHLRTGIQTNEVECQIEWRCVFTQSFLYRLQHALITRMSMRMQQIEGRTLTRQASEVLHVNDMDALYHTPL